MERLIGETTLFLHNIDRNIEQSSRSIVKEKATRGDSLKGKTILIVDDDMRNVFALTNVLEKNGIKVIPGRNGREGLDKLSKHPEVNLVIMDVMMPEMDGYEAMRSIRSNPKFSKLPIIALTAKAMKEDRKKCIDAGANDYMIKPIDSEKLISLLRVWLYQ
ncbi:CAI-1 autoinducer sensor kinase/phosphatase CqsS [bioreactor metagenome]|uniref:CAI-1 autoinducer sensor kinase/phosphatase CqsS n=1 Tax=bioreactor metagenome TaxID=1076179 RepID=A0A645HYX5_9ZZZZ